MNAIYTFVDNFFSCRECRDHFIEMYDNCEYDRCKIDENSNNKEIALWLWRIHNNVNRRVKSDNAAWPSEEHPWDNDDTIYNYLVETYKWDEKKEEEEEGDATKKQEEDEQNNFIKLSSTKIALSTVGLL